MATITDADAQAWLERQADHYMNGGQFTSDALPGITSFGTRVALPRDALCAAVMYDAVGLVPIEFYVAWGGMELTTTRDRATNPGHSNRQACP